jgi:hypothetical protein
VCRPLTDALHVARDAEKAYDDRFSVQDGGIEKQVARHCALYSGDPEFARALPSSGFDSPAVGAAHDIRRPSLADIHHSLTDRKPVVAFVVMTRPAVIGHNGSHQPSTINIPTPKPVSIGTSYRPRHTGLVIQASHRRCLGVPPGAKITPAGSS